MECYCDYDPAEFLATYVRKARKPHKCEACSAVISPGAQYEIVAGKWDGEFATFHTCMDCQRLREYVIAHVPCFCWSYQMLYDEARETLREYVHHVPGMAMESGRLMVAMRRRMRDATKIRRSAA